MTTRRKLHWTTDVGDTVCGRYASDVKFAKTRDTVTCGSCLRRMPPPIELEPVELAPEPRQYVGPLHPIPPHIADEFLKTTPADRVQLNNELRDALGMTETPPTHFLIGVPRGLEDNVYLDLEAALRCDQCDHVRMLRFFAGAMLCRRCRRACRVAFRRRNRQAVPAETRRERRMRGTRKYRREGTKAFAYRNEPTNIHYRGKPADIARART